MLLTAYTNDFEHADMAAASGDLLFITGLARVSVFVIGWLMTRLAWTAISCSSRLFAAVAACSLADDRMAPSPSTAFLPLRCRCCRRPRRWRWPWR